MKEKYRLYEYKDENGNFDYELYRSTQEFHNKRKINRVWVAEDSIKAICHETPSAEKILCHGTRNGAEQKLFKNMIPNCFVLGTEISETATDFPDTIQWDFHEIKPEWINHFDIIYSNSLDHSYKPQECLQNWAKCINDKGYMVLEHSLRGHRKHASNSKDPFGCDQEDFPDFINKALGNNFIIDKTISVDERRKLFFIKRRM